MKSIRQRHPVAAIFTGLVALAPPVFSQGMMRGSMMGGGAPEVGTQPGAISKVPATFSQNGCMGCHAVARAGYGPAFSWVAWKYRQQGDAVASVSAFIEHGGTSTWGGAMPNLNVPPAQAREMARWILQLHPVQPPQTKGGG